jgi:hypothetical protein
MKGAIAVVGVIAFAIGAAVGVAVVYGKLDEARTERDALASECGELRTEMSRLAQAREDALVKADRALAKVDDYKERAAMEPVVAEAALKRAETPEEALPELDDEPQDDDGGRRDRGRRGRDDDGNPQTVPLEQAMRRAEMRERFEGMRETAYLALDEAIAKSSDSAEQQRLAALADTSATMMELFGQMREAQTDEERDALRAAIGETHQSQRALLDEQRDYKTRKILGEYGVSSNQKQNEFMSALEQLRSDPVLSSPMLGGWGGGPGRGGRGRGSGR